jgi:hypothetical protein
MSLKRKPDSPDSDSEFSDIKRAKLVEGEFRLADEEDVKPEEDAEAEVREEDAETAVKEEVTALAIAKESRLAPRVFVLQETEAPSQQEYMQRFDQLVKSASVEAINRGDVLVKLPDAAVLLWSKASLRNIHVLELGEKKKILVVRTEKKMPVNGKRVGTGEWFVNLKTKYDQSFEDLKLLGYSQMSSFSRVAYIRHGSSVETGVEGNRGKLIKGKAIQMGSESYQFDCTNKSYNRNINDEDDNNPIATQAFKMWDEMAMRVLTTLVAGPTCITAIKLAAVKINGAPFASVDESAAFIRNSSLFCGKVKKQPEDETAVHMSVSVSCYRGLRNAYIGNETIFEDLSTYVAPSEMFVRNTHTSKNTLQVHNEIPLFRCRRFDEVEPGKHYSSPFIRVPFKNAVLTSDDVIAVVYSVNVYEDLMGACGLTNKQLAYVWLNTVTALKAMNQGEIDACDPRYAVPMAGYYRGPLGYEGAAPSE